MPERAKQALLLGILAALLGVALLALRRLHPLDANLVEAVAVLWAAAILYFIALWRVFSWRESSRAALLVVLVAAAVFRATLAFCALYAVSDEWHQGFVPGRGPSALDVSLDALSAWLACAVQNRWGASAWNRFFSRTT